MHPTPADPRGTLLKAVLIAIQRGYRVHTVRLERDSPEDRKMVTASPPKGWHELAQQSADQVRSAITFGGHTGYLVHCPSSGVTLLDGDTPEDLVRHKELTGVPPHVISPSGPHRAHTYVAGVYGTDLDPKVKATAFGPGSFIAVRSTGELQTYVGELPPRESLPVPKDRLGGSVTPLTGATGQRLQRPPSLLDQLTPPKSATAARAQWDRLAADVTAEVRRSVTTGRWDRDRLLALAWELGQLTPSTAHRDWDLWFRAGGAAPDDRDIALVDTALERGRPDSVVRDPASPAGGLPHTPFPPRAQGTGAAEQGDDNTASFWDARPELRRIHDFARSRRAAPLAVLGAVLVDVVAMVEPNVQLPAIVGSRASLNLFLALVGRPGAGKDIAQDVAREAIVVAGSLPGVEPGWADRLNLGSGQGMAHAYMRPAGRGEEAPTQVRTRAVLLAGEIDTLASHSSMKGSTLLSEIRKLWMGQSFGHQYADHTRRVPVSPHSYRACLVAGVQPERAAVLLDDEAGGTPQRFIWLPAEDPGAPDVAPPQPDPWTWTPPLGGAIGSVVELDVCATARTAIDADRLSRLRGAGEGLDAHAMLARLKTAAALGVLAGRLSVTEDDWSLAGALLEVSSATRGRCASALAEQAAEKNTAAAEAEGRRSDYLEQRATKRVSARVLEHLTEGAQSRSALRRRFASRDRATFDGAVEMLVMTGAVVVETTEQGIAYRRVT